MSKIKIIVFDEKESAKLIKIVGKDHLKRNLFRLLIKGKAAEDKNK